MEECSVPVTGAVKGMVCWVSLEKREMESSGRGDWKQRLKPDHSDPVATQASPAFIFWSKVSHDWNGPCNWSGGSQKWVTDQKHQHPLGTHEKFKAWGSTAYLPNQKLNYKEPSRWYWHILNLRSSALKYREGHISMREKNKKSKTDNSVQRLLQKPKKETV